MEFSSYQVDDYVQPATGDAFPEGVTASVFSSPCDEVAGEINIFINIHDDKRNSIFSCGGFAVTNMHATLNELIKDRVIFDDMLSISEKIELVRDFQKCLSSSMLTCQLLISDLTLADA